MNKCLNKVMTINVSVKGEGQSEEEPKEDSYNYTWVYVVVGIVGFLLVAFAVFLIVRKLIKNNNLEIKSGETGLLVSQ